MAEPVIELSDVSKMYGGLRPLRIRQLSIAAGERVGLAGFDVTTAEVFVNLVTGSTLPETGQVRVFGRATSDITDSDEWLRQVDRFGIVSERIVLLDQYSIVQNVAMALTLELGRLPDDARGQAVALARDAGLDDLDRPVAGLPTAARHRVRLARSLAAAPSVLLVEHPRAGLDDADVVPLAADLRRAAAARGIAVVVLAADPAHARPFVDRVARLNAATGDLVEDRWWHRLTRR